MKLFSGILIEYVGSERCAFSKRLLTEYVLETQALVAAYWNCPVHKLYDLQTHCVTEAAAPFIALLVVGLAKSF